MEVAIFSFGMLLVRRDIKQLAGWYFFCAFVLLEIYINIELGTILQPGFSAPTQQTGFHVYGVLNLAEVSGFLCVRRLGNSANCHVPDDCMDVC